MTLSPPPRLTAPLMSSLARSHTGAGGSSVLKPCFLLVSCQRGGHVGRDSPAALLGTSRTQEGERGLSSRRSGAEALLGLSASNGWYKLV